MGCCRLRNLPVWLGLNGMNQIWELDGILNKENRNIVANNIEIAFVSVEPDSKAVNVSGSICGAPTSCNRGEADEGWGLLVGSIQERGTGDVRPVSEGLEGSVSSSTTSMDGAFWNALMIYMYRLTSRLRWWR
jgi:hypothetical protein